MKKVLFTLSMSSLMTFNCFLSEQAFAQQPDLTLANGKITYNASTHELNITVDVKNIGNGDVGLGSTARVGCFLSTDATVSSNDYFITAFNFSYGIFAGTCYCNSSSGNIDISTITNNLPYGTYYVLMKADDTEKVAESNESNNLFNAGTINYGNATSISEKREDNRFIMENYPNPVQATTSFVFQLPENGFTTLKIYDITGTEVYTVVEQELQAGKHKYDFNGNNLASGVYFYTLFSQNGKKTGSMMIY